MAFWCINWLNWTGYHYSVARDNLFVYTCTPVFQCHSSSSVREINTDMTEQFAEVK